MPKGRLPGYSHPNTQNGIYNSSLVTASSAPGGGRILALDVGKKRIGLAVSDELRLTAQGLPTLERTRIRDDLKKLADLAQEYSLGLLLIGKPLHMSGSESRQSEYTREFAERLSKSVRLPLVYWDERWTSMEAERMLKEAGKSLDERKKAVDRFAAILLLESYLGYLSLSDTVDARGSLA